MERIFPATLIAAIATFNSAFATDIDFNRDVRPILSDKCFFCHGPDEENREADLQLDSRETAADVIDSGKLLKRILTDDPDTRMPPADSKLSLSDEDKSVLKQWLSEGAKYQDHWAFEPLPASVAVPRPDGSKWVRQTLDRFVLKRIEAARQQPNPEAAPRRWLRRATLDLTGLPPTTAQLLKFQNRLAEPGASQETVYRTTVNAFLDSPAFGEHMAVSLAGCCTVRRFVRLSIGQTEHSVAIS